MIVRPSPNGPMKQPLRLFNRQIVNARMTMLHQSRLIELPVLIPIRSVPLPSRVMRLITKPHSDTISPKRPKLFNQTILELLRPFARQKFDDLFPSGNKLRSVAPYTVYRVSKRNPLRIA